MTQAKQNVSNVPKLRFKEFFGEWEKKRLGEVSSNISYGIGASAVKYDGINKYLRITDIDEESRCFIPNPLSSPDLKIEKRYILKENDIVFARTGASVGKSYLYNNEDGNLIFAGFLIKASIHAANSTFIFNLTLRSRYKKWVKIMSVRSGQPGINAEEYKSFSFNLPKLPEQQKIASFLSSIDEKIESIKEKKEKIEEFKKGVMQKIFSQEMRFTDENGESFGEWEEKKLGEICNFEQGVQVDLDLQLLEKCTGYIKFLRIENYTQKSQDFRFIPISVSNNKVITTDEIAIVRYGATAGFIGRGFEGVLANNLFKVIPNDKLTNNFLFIILNRVETFNFFQSAMAGGAMPALSFGIVKQLNIDFPSLPEQQKITDYLSGIDEKIEKVDEELKDVEEFKKGLLQKMFV